MLSETKSCIKINQLCSDYFSISNGVRQGDPISSTLFSIFINDLVYKIKTLNYGIKLEDQNVSILLYADELVLIATNEYELQEMIETLYLWTKKWRISINSEKSNIMHFRTARKRQTEFEFKLGNNCLTITNSYKYLGCILDTNLNYSLCIETLSASGQCALGSVITTFKGYKDMGIETYKKLYSSCVVPIIDNCCPVWFFADTTKISQVQNLAIHTFMGVHRFAPIIAVIGDCGWLPSLYRHQIEVLRYWNRLISMKNSRLAKMIFLDDFNNDRQKSWCNYVRNIMNQFDLNEIFVNKLSCNLDFVKDRALHNFTAWWKEQVVNKPKLRFYRFLRMIHLLNYI